MCDVFILPSLQRFDSIDPGMSVSGLSLGKSALFSTSVCDGPLRVILTDVRRVKQKPVQLNQRTIASVLKEAKQRLNMRQKPKIAKLIGGDEVTDQTLAAMPNDTVLVVS